MQADHLRILVGNFEAEMVNVKKAQLSGDPELESECLRQSCLPCFSSRAERNTNGPADDQAMCGVFWNLLT